MNKKKRNSIFKVGNGSITIAGALILWILASVITIANDIDACKQNAQPYTFSDAWETIVDYFIGAFIIALIAWIIMKIIYDRFFAPSEWDQDNPDKE